MKDHVFLEYMFVFEPSTAFAHLYEFERSLAEFFSQKGFDAQVLETVDGATGRHIFYIARREVIEASPSNTDRSKMKAVTQAPVMQPAMDALNRMKEKLTKK